MRLQISKKGLGIGLFCCLTLRAMSVYLAHQQVAHRAVFNNSKKPTIMGIIDYLRDTRGELRHVSWPTRNQTVAFTAIVLAISISVGLFLGFLDSTLGQVLDKIVTR